MKTINFAVSEHNSRVYSLIFLGDNMKFKKYATKTLMIVIGSIISAYGITLAIGEVSAAQHLRYCGKG